MEKLFHLTLDKPLTSCYTQRYQRSFSIAQSQQKPRPYFLPVVFEIRLRAHAHGVENNNESGSKFRCKNNAKRLICITNQPMYRILAPIDLSSYEDVTLGKPFFISEKLLSVTGEKRLWCRCYMQLNRTRSLRPRGNL